MTRKLKRIAPLQLGKMLGVLYGLMGLIFLPFVLLASVFGAFASHSGNSSAPPATAFAGIGIVFALLIPIMYAVFGFIGGVVGAWIYNIVAGLVGGIEVEVE
jgi:hypothetical protein